MSKFILDAQGGQMHGEIRTQDVTVSGGPTLLPTDDLRGRKEFSLHNGSGDSIWLGGGDVTQYNGMPLADNANFSSKLGRAQLYGTTAGPTVSGIRIMEIA